MRDYYVDAMLKLNTDLSEHIQLKKDGLCHAFKSIYESNDMTEDHYIQYVELLFTDDPKQELVAQVS